MVLRSRLTQEIEEKSTITAARFDETEPAATKNKSKAPAKPGRCKVRTLGVAAGSDAAQASDAFDDFFGCGVGGGVGSPAAVAGEGEEFGARGCGAVGSDDGAGDAVGYAVVEAGFDEDELDVVRCGALVELGEEQLALHGHGLNFNFQSELLAHGKRGDTAAEE